ncbi:MAG: signal peptide peptidase SppA, partial [Oligoflexales bacterium]|nr:signal peptide peptidase SppA [Oligoflexales bacterium]
EQGIDPSSIFTSVRRAASDSRVNGIFLTIDSLDSSLAMISEIRESLEKFRETKKPIWIHINSADTSEYYLATIADQLTLTPSGSLMIPGPMFQLIYVKSALQKIGVHVDVVKQGKYKSAMESFVEDSPSRETLEMYSSMEDRILEYLIKNMAKIRKKPNEDVRRWLEKSIFTANEAVKLGLVDVLNYREEVKEELVKITDSNSIISMQDYLDATDNLDDPVLDHTGNKVALIEAVGTIYDDSNSASSSINDSITPRRMIKEINWALEDDDIKAVVMRVSSPGGSALASDIIWNHVKKLSAKKPVVVSMSSVAASGGYYISAPATKIVAEPTTITGSIGVISAIPKLDGFKEKFGINFYMLTRSKRSDLFNIGKRLSQSDLKALSDQGEFTYRTFLDKVAEGRKMPLEKVEKLAEGRVYTGAEAIDIGLVDREGSISDAFALAKELAGLDPLKLYPLEKYRGNRLSPFECLKSSQNLFECLREIDSRSMFGIISGEKPSSFLTKKIEDIVSEIQILTQKKGILAYLPCHQVL